MLFCSHLCIFSERRKIERRIRRLEKMQRSSSGSEQDAEIVEQLSKLKEDLEYVRVGSSWGASQFVNVVLSMYVTFNI